jgi:phosphatidylglycerol lysyltransferase
LRAQAPFRQRLLSQQSNHDHPAADVPPLLPELRAVSDAWLAEKHTRDKGFSLGRFDDQYLVQFPLATVRQAGQLIAFANLWIGADKAELAPDLMRYLPDAPPSIMEYLLLRLMGWGKPEGYQWFNLGMAPLSGLEDHTLAPLWNRLGALVFRHGEHFYNFQGLRQYKEKFDPMWEPKYLAAPGGLALPRILTNLATRISGGLSGVISK